MANYSIKDLENLTGIKAHTIRIWEKRYNIVDPVRTDTNIRTYSDADLKKLLNISFLNQNGYKISKIAEMSFFEIVDTIKDIASPENKKELHINELVKAMIDMDETEFERVIVKSTEELGFEIMVTHVLYPFLEKIGVLWLTNHINPAQEHFMSNLIRQKLLSEIDKLPILSDHSSRKALVFLNQYELHEIGILYYSYLLRKWGIKVVYLGQMVPTQDIIEVAKIHNPTMLFTSFISSIPKGKLTNLLKTLTDYFEGKQILQTGLTEKDHPLVGKTIQVQNPEHLKKVLEEKNLLPQ